MLRAVDIPGTQQWMVSVVLNGTVLETFHDSYTSAHKHLSSYKNGVTTARIALVKETYIFVDEEPDIKALKESIAKWEKNVTAEIPDDVALGAADCPLCVLYNNTRHVCRPCPVYKKTNEQLCFGTPYAHAQTAAMLWEQVYGTSSAYLAEKVFRQAAKQEVEFLKSLLPKEEEK